MNEINGILAELSENGISVAPGNGLDPIEATMPELRKRISRLKFEIINRLREQAHIPCQVQWMPDCSGPEATTTKMLPNRYELVASSKQYAIICDSCRRVFPPNRSSTPTVATIHADANLARKSLKP